MADVMYSSQQSYGLAGGSMKDENDVHREVAEDEIRYQRTDDPNISYTQLPDHWRVNKSLPTAFRVRLHSPEPDGTKIVIAAGNEENESADLRNNISYLKNGIARFHDLRFVGRSGRGKKLSLTISVRTADGALRAVVVRNVIKITVDGPRESRRKSTSTREGGDMLQPGLYHPHHHHHSPGFNYQTYYSGGDTFAVPGAPAFQVQPPSYGYISDGAAASRVCHASVSSPEGDMPGLSNGFRAGSTPSLPELAGSSHRAVSSVGVHSSLGSRDRLQSLSPVYHNAGMSQPPSRNSTPATFHSTSASSAHRSKQRESADQQSSNSDNIRAYSPAELGSSLSVEGQASITNGSSDGLMPAGFNEVLEASAAPASNGRTFVPAQVPRITEAAFLYPSSNISGAHVQASSPAFAPPECAQTTPTYVAHHHYYQLPHSPSGHPPIISPLPVIGLTARQPQSANSPSYYISNINQPFSPLRLSSPNHHHHGTFVFPPVAPALGTHQQQPPPLLQESKRQVKDT